jgi:2-keto-4-pentenoate hydratase
LETIETTAVQLERARKKNEPVTASVALLPDALSAYAVQEAVAARFGWYCDGPARYWKSGGPSRESVLTHAPLPPEGIWLSPAEAGDWPFQMRGVEAEIALRLACEVTPAMASELDANQAAKLVDAMCVSIEVVDSRWIEGLDAPALAKLADLQSHGALVLGEWTPTRVLDWGQQTCTVQIGGQPLVERRGTHPMNDPFFVLPDWLRHATRQGKSAPAGTVVTTGTWVGILSAAAGDHVHVTFEGIGQASVKL